MADYEHITELDPQTLYVQEQDESGDVRYVELTNLAVYRGLIPKEGYWKIFKYGNGSKELRLISHLRDNVPLYPFLNVEKYRDTVISALSSSFGENLTLANIADNIIAAIADKLKHELDNRTISKEDFYD